MLVAPIPINEEDRLAALRELRVLSTPSEERFDRITTLACRIFDVPIAMISLIDATRQWFKSVQGLQVRETPRDVAFCAHTILDDGPMIVADTLLDPRFADNPLVIGEPFIRFYAGHPVRHTTGHNIGTLMILDRKPRHLSDDQVEALRDLAIWVENELSLRRINEAQIELINALDVARKASLVDPLTQLWNRRAILDLLESDIAHARRDRNALSVAMADLDHFKKVNDGFGHQAGDEVLREATNRMRAMIRPYDSIGRYGGEEFLIIFPGCDAQKAQVAGDKVRLAMHSHPISTTRGMIMVSMSMGVATCNYAEREMPADALIHAADMALYRSKSNGRNRVELA